MKQFIIFIFFCFAIASCARAPGPADANSVQPNNNLDSTVSISAAINGIKWQTDTAVGYVVKNSGNDSLMEGIQIVSYPGNNNYNNSANTMVFNLTFFTGPGTYIIDPPVNEVTYYIGTARHLALSGQVVVASDTAYALKGTFNFVTDSFTVTNGVFNVAMP
jgi:hypothetical protein